MTKHMIISPDPSVDGTWVEGWHGAIHWAAPLAAASMTATPDVLGDAPEILTAVRQRYYHPSWRVVLAFWVDSRMGMSPRLPLGRVMPGWVEGVELAQSRLGVWLHLKATHRWALMIDRESVYVVTCEVLDRGARWVQERLAREGVQPLPPEALNGCPPNPDPAPDVPWTPLTPDELADLLRGDPDDDPSA